MGLGAVLGQKELWGRKVLSEICFCSFQAKAPCGDSYHSVGSCPAGLLMGMLTWELFLTLFEIHCVRSLTLQLK